MPLSLRLPTRPDGCSRSSRFAGQAEDAALHADAALMAFQSRCYESCRGGFETRPYVFLTFHPHGVRPQPLSSGEGKSNSAPTSTSPRRERQEKGSPLVDLVRL